MPAATTENVAPVGAVTNCADGCVVIEGATDPEFTVNVAAVLVMLPALLEMNTVNTAPLSDNAVGFSVYDDPIAPPMGAPLRRH